MGFVEWFMGLPEALAWLALVVVLLGEMGMILHFLPTEAIMILGTLRLAHDPFSLGLVILVATVASVAGAFLPYALARYGGRPLLFRYARLLHLTPARMERFERIFAGRLGESLVLVCRIIPGLRTAPSIPAGLARMSLAKFLVFTTIGCLVFNTIFALLAHFYGEPFLHAVEEWTHAALALLWGQRFTLAAVLAVLLAGAVALWRRRRRKRPAPDAPVVAEGSEEGGPAPEVEGNPPPSSSEDGPLAEKDRQG